MELKQLQYFLAVAEAKGFQKAAKKHFISQQALSKAIQKLENELNVPLFTRTRYGVELNSYGETFLKRAEHILSDVEEAIEELNTKGDRESNVRFGITLGLLEIGLSEHLNLFRKEHPNVELIIYEASDELIEQSIMTAKLDMALLAGPSPDDSRFKSTVLYNYKTFLAIHKNHPLANLNSIKIVDLESYPIVGCPGDYNIHKIIVHHFEKNGITPLFGMTSINHYRVRESLLNSDAVFFVPENLFPHVAAPEIIFKPIEDDPVLFSPTIITSRVNSPQPPVVKAFKTHLLNISPSLIVPSSDSKFDFFAGATI